MSQPLTTKQKQKIEDALDLVDKILDCCDDQVESHGTPPDPNSKKLRDNLIVLPSLMFSGRIDIESSGGGAAAEADGDGIHFDDQHGAFPLKTGSDALPLTDAWHIIGTLLHEKYHYLNHRGLGALRKAWNVPGFVALVLLRLVGLKIRSFQLSETLAYWHAYRMLGVLDNNLFYICLNNPDCLQDCEDHKLGASDARNKQKPY